jgi:RNA polymerase sigma factor (TIGR02999 family)
MAAGYFAGQSPGHTLQPTALVNEALMRMIKVERVGNGGRWNSHGHFLAVAATAMRQILVDYARAKAALKRSGVPVRLEAGPTRAQLDVLDLNDAIDRLARLDERAGRVVVLRFFAGLTIAQVADALEVSTHTVESDWRAARAYLARELGGALRGNGA